MIQRCLNENELPEIHQLVDNNCLQVPYLYANLHKYGIGNNDIKLWTDRIDGALHGVYLKYYNCLHFFTDLSDYPINSFIQMVDRCKPKVIMLQDDFGLKAESSLSEHYLAKPEFLVKLIPHNGGQYVEDVSVANENDIDEITDLLMTDTVYSDVYTWDELNNQLLERHREGFGKCFIIRRDNKIVTAYVINGECDRFYILGGLITHPDYRRQGLGQIILGHVLKELNEKKMCIDFLLTDNIATIELHKKWGMTPEKYIRKYYLK